MRVPGLRLPQSGRSPRRPASVCVCCLADCPHVHGPNGVRPERYTYTSTWDDAANCWVGLTT